MTDERLTNIAERIEALEAIAASWPDDAEEREGWASEWGGYQSRFHSIASHLADWAFQASGSYEPIEAPETRVDISKSLASLKKIAGKATPPVQAVEEK